MAAAAGGQLGYGDDADDLIMPPQLKWEDEPMPELESLPPWKDAAPLPLPLPRRPVTGLVSIEHFRAPLPKQRDAMHSRCAPPFNESQLYDVNPAPASRLMRVSNALDLSDDCGRTYWDACDDTNARVNREWIERFKQSRMYEEGDCILMVKNNKRDKEYTSFPEEGRTHEFLTTRGPDVDAPDDDGVTYRVTSTVTHTSYHDKGYASRQTCYVVVRGQFQYHLPEHY
jgi:hypothetical protein